MPIRYLHIVRQFLQLEAVSGILLIIMTLFAMIVANSDWRAWYQALLNQPMHLFLVNFTVTEPVLFWINEGLMTFFFLLIGLELKREYLEGELSHVSSVLLPLSAAIGGMLIPGIIFIGFNYHDAEKLQGWAVPVATDIAFSLGVLSLLGSRIPSNIKYFLMTVAIFDDIGAILIIVFFYSHSLSFVYIALSLLAFSLLLLFNYFAVHRILPYLLMGFVLWIFLLQSGIHATLAGILLALAIPLNGSAEKNEYFLHRFETVLHPCVAYLIMPLFAFANAGLSFAGMTWHIFFESVTLGVFLGLFLGKQVGIYCFSRIVVQLRWAALPYGVSWAQLYGTAMLCGIGFTMSLFLGTLSYQHHLNYMMDVRLGVLASSIVSAIFGFTLLWMSSAKKNTEEKIA